MGQGIHFHQLIEYPNGKVDDVMCRQRLRHQEAVVYDVRLAHDGVEALHAGQQERRLERVINLLLDLLRFHIQQLHATHIRHRHWNAPWHTPLIP